MVVMVSAAAAAVVVVVYLQTSFIVCLLYSLLDCLSAKVAVKKKKRKSFILNHTQISTGMAKVTAPALP